MNNEGAGSQDSTLPAKKLFKRRLKRVADDDSDEINDNKVNQANEASGEPASKEHDQISESNAGNIQTAQSSKQQPGLGNSKEEDSGLQAFELKRLRRRTLKKTYNEGSERSHGEPNSQPAHTSQAIDVESPEAEPQKEDDESSYQMDEKAKQKRQKKKKKGTADSVNYSDEASDIEDQVSLDSVEKANKTRKARNPKQKRVNFEDDDEIGAATKGAQKKSTKRQGVRTQQKAKENLDLCLNRVKTKNKLIGEIEDNDVFKNDEDCLDGFGYGQNRGDRDDEDERLKYQGKDIEIDFSIPGKSKSEVNNNVTGFLNKMKTKRQQQEQAQGVEQEIINYGFVQALANKLSANQLAASGIQLSMRQKLIQFMNEMDKQKITSNEQQLLDALKSSQDGTQKEAPKENAEKEDQVPVVTEPPAPSTSLLPEKGDEVAEEAVGTSLAADAPMDDAGTKEAVVAEGKEVEQVPDNESDQDVLEFFDPAAESRKEKEANLLEAQKNRQKQGAIDFSNAQAIKRAATLQMANLNVGSSMNQRTNLLKQLKDQKIQKMSRNLTLEHVKETFQQTDWNHNPSKSKAKFKAVGIDGKEVELHDEDDDSDYKEDDDEDENGDASDHKSKSDQYVDNAAANKSMEDASDAAARKVIARNVWDDEENFIEEVVEEAGNLAMSEEGEDEDLEEVRTQQLDKSEKLTVDDAKVLSQGDESDTIKAKGRRRLKKTKSQASKASSKGDGVSHGQKKKRGLQKSRLAGFFEDEAELGSDNEANDAAKKEINRQDLEENEEGLDSELEGFIDHTKDGRGDNALHRDDQEIEDLEEAARLKYIQDMQNDDKIRTKLAMEAAIFGRKKRNREEAGLDDKMEDLDEYERRKLERIKEREQIMNSQEEEEMQQQLLEGGKQRVLEARRLKELQEEEEMSDDEIRQQIDLTKYYKFIQQKDKKDQIKEIKERELQMELELQKELHGLRNKETNCGESEGVDSKNLSLKEKSSLQNFGAKAHKDNLGQISSSSGQRSLPKHGFRKMPTTFGKMLDRKQIQTTSGINAAALKSFTGASTKASVSAFPLKKSATTVAEDDNKKKSYSGGSMFNFFKQNQFKDGNNNVKKDTTPMVFRQRKVKAS